MVMTRVMVGRHAEQVSESVEGEVPERPTRRVFSPVYKLRILAEYERSGREAKGALLRLPAPSAPGTPTTCGR